MDLRFTFFWSFGTGNSVIVKKRYNSQVPIIDYEKYLWMRKIIDEQCLSSNIYNNDAPDKKKKAIVDSICISLINSNINEDKLNELITDINSFNVINIAILFNGGNLFANYVNSRWVVIAREMFAQRSVGIGTPNAASGEGELMFLFLCGKQVEKPSSGDLKVNNKMIELKGNGPRFQANISGRDFRKKTVDLVKSYNLKPNTISYTMDEEAAELEKMQHNTHWQNELSKIPLTKQKDLINKWLGIIDNKDHNDSTDKIFYSGTFNQQILIKEIVKILFSIHLLHKPFDYFVMLGDGTNVKVINNDIKSFGRLVDDGKITILSDYFRVKQSFPIGWYVN